MAGNDYAAYRRNNRELPNEPNQAWRAEVVVAPASVNDSVVVRAVNQAGGDTFTTGPAPWPQPHGKELPEVGDECLVVVDEERAAWVVAWQTPDWPGVTSGSGDLHFVYTQGSPASTWVIVHGLKKFPSVTVQDTANDEVEGIIEYLSNEEIAIVFSSPFSGKAYLN